jgi:hypothetical protein
MQADWHSSNYVCQIALSPGWQVAIEGIKTGWQLDRRTIGVFIRLSIAAPSPPNRATLTLVKFLPLLATIVGVDGRSAIEPNILRREREGTAGRTAKFKGMDGLGCPFGRGQRESIHRTNG